MKNMKTMKRTTLLFAATLFFLELTGLQAQTVKDIGGNVYKTVTIGNQVWMQENLKTTKYRNGDLIGTTTKNNDMERSPKYQWSWENDEKNVIKYGRLYTWYAVIDNRNLCPIGWHVPTEYDFSTLRNYLVKNGKGSVGKSLASASGWSSDPNEGSSVGHDQNKNNSSGFTGLPAGWRDGRGYFIGLGTEANWWSTSQYSAGLDSERAQLLDVVSQYDNFETKSKWGYSVRCIKD
jgi:uncharacterized protein (TIGR02145 family)